MSDLLVGCRASGKSIGHGDIVEGVIVRVSKSVYIMTSEGKLVPSYGSDVIIHPDDVRFITQLSKNYQVRKKILTERIERFEILDL